MGEISKILQKYFGLILSSLAFILMLLYNDPWWLILTFIGFGYTSSYNRRERRKARESEET